MAICGNRLHSDQRQRLLLPFSAIIVLLDHTCNLSVCVGGQALNTQTHKSPLFSFYSCSCTQCMGGSLSVTHPPGHVVGPQQQTCFVIQTSVMM